MTTARLTPAQSNALELLLAAALVVCCPESRQWSATEEGRKLSSSYRPPEADV